MELETGKIIEYELESDVVSAEGEKLIREYLLATCEWQFLPYDWDWRWNIKEKGEYTGRLPTRISKFYKTNFNLKLSTETLAKLGSLGRENTCASTKYIFDFDQELNWQQGEFGDDESCFWGGKRAARKMLRDHGAYAMRFYEEEKTYYGDTGYSGIGRCWLVPYRESLIAFNSYGYELPTTTQVLAHYLKRHYQRVELRNGGKAKGMLWINGGTGFAVGKSETIEGWDLIDLEWPVPPTCADCHEVLVETRQHAGNLYCPVCYEQYYNHCVVCGDLVRAENLLSLYDESSHVCLECLPTLRDTPELCKCYRCWRQATGYCANCNQFFCENHAH